MELTELDEALKAAQDTHENANFFYDAFLNTEIFIPALRADKRPREWMKLNKRFFPLYFTHGETRAVPVFDRLEKKKGWAGDRMFDYLKSAAYFS